jgi:adenosylhomocysteine nucleosidase
MASTAPIVILGALEQELAAFHRRTKEGKWRGVEVRFALTGVGKVAAAATTQRMIAEHRPAAVLFTGVAGSLDPARNIGDIGIGVAAIDADFDVRAWMPGHARGQLPFGGGRLWASDPELVRLALAAPVPGLFPAYIATGSAFLDSAGKAAFHRDVLPDLAAELDGRSRRPDLIEMEGSAVLQIAAANKIPALAIRAVSDGFAGDAVADFNGFIARSVEIYAGVVEHVLDHARF